MTAKALELDWRDLPSGDSLQENVNYYLERAFERLELEDRFPHKGITERLTRSDSVVERKISLQMDDGSVRCLRSWRSQHNNDCGIYKGGLRWDEEVTGGQIEAMSSGMTWKAALADIPFGGAKGGVRVDPNALSHTEKERLAKAYMRVYADVLGPTKDVPAPDMGTDSQVMAWIFKRYTELRDDSINPGIVTGKPVGLFGSHGRTEATGFGLALAVSAFADLRDARVVVQGFGNVGMHAALKARELGARVIGLFDPLAFGGGVVNPDGLDIPAMAEHIERHGKDTLGEAWPATHDLDDLWDLDCDILMPCARENALNAANADRVKARVIGEGANGPTTPEAHVRLMRRGVTVVPDALGNSGGVIVSYFEWLQNLSQEYWSAELVQEKLETKMRANARRVVDYATKNGVDARTACYMIAVDRVARARLLLGAQ